MEICYFKVGEKIPFGTATKEDRLYYQFDKNGHQIFLHLARISLKDEEQFKKNDLKVAVYNKEDIIFLLLNINGFMEWSDCPYSYHLVQPELQFLPNNSMDENKGELLSLYLVNAEDHILRGIRMVRLSCKFTNTLNQMIRKQATQVNYNVGQHYLQVQEIQSCISPKEMFRRADMYCKIS